MYWDPVAWIAENNSGRRHGLDDWRTQRYGNWHEDAKGARIRPWWPSPPEMSGPIDGLRLVWATRLGGP